MVIMLAQKYRAIVEMIDRVVRDVYSWQICRYAEPSHPHLHRPVSVLRCLSQSKSLIINGGASQTKSYIQSISHTL